MAPLPHGASSSTASPRRGLLEPHSPPPPSTGSSPNRDEPFHHDPARRQGWISKAPDPVVVATRTWRRFQAQSWRFRVATFLLLIMLLLWASGIGRYPLPTFTYRVIPPHTTMFKTVEREPGNLQRMVNDISPRDPPIARKPGILAVPVGAKSKHKMLPVLDLFDREGFEIILFHYDDADWSEVPGYSRWTSVRSHRQTKFWYAKRFLTPRVVEIYDYVFLWDDDVGLPEGWSPTAFVQLLKDYNIHMAQPALLSGSHYEMLEAQTPSSSNQRRTPPRSAASVTTAAPPRTHEKREARGKPPNEHGNQPTHIGRFSNFIEVMFPVISRAAWPCAWRLMPFDGVSYWGLDIAWYPVCAAHGMCRFAVIDSMPVHHLDERRLTQSFHKNIVEQGYYREMVFLTCRQGPKMTIVDSINITEPYSMQAHTWRPSAQSRAVCDYYSKHTFGGTFYSIRSISRQDDLGKATCPEPQYWTLPNMPWWGPEKDPPPHQAGWWLGREEELAKVRQIKEYQDEERRRLASNNG